jgi:hypothetical protein
MRIAYQISYTVGAICSQYGCARTRVPDENMTWESVTAPAPIETPHAVLYEMHEASALAQINAPVVTEKMVFGRGA